LNKRITDEIVRFVVESPANLREDGGRYFDAPLVGFAALDDPLFTDYRRIIGDHHLPPSAFLADAGGTAPASGTVVCWVLPICGEVRESNRPEERVPSRLWSHTRQFGEALNAALRRHLTQFLGRIGYRAVAPQLSPSWREVATPAGPTSSWSERHAAYAAGLGTFSLNDGLITPRGIAHRCGSVVTELVLAPTPRTAPNHTHNCLYHRNGSCGACVGRCPVGALSLSGHDKPACRDYVYGALPAELSDTYGVQATGCGLCQTRVPCEFRIP
jgi:epoxyqueuosine reductase QueG